jgi:riboflavin kinase / FMN adenylyltransferase
MRVLDFSSGTGPAELVALPPNTAACLGAFDGMHRGHQALIARARACADEVAVVTFEPRPADVLAPERAPARLASPEQRERVCRQLGVDSLVILPFNLEVSRLSPAEFVRAFLIDGLRPAGVVVGYDFHFGARRAGGPAELRALLAEVGVEVEVVDKVAEDGEKLGSTAIRELVRRGEVERAGELLGRLYAVDGVVEHGFARGRDLGYPTANVASRSLYPADGVYATFLTVFDDAGHDERETWPAVANLGSNPTFPSPSSGPTTTLEVHAFDVDLGERLYGRKVEVSFVARLRDELRFDGVEALREAIAADIEAAHSLLAGPVVERRHARRLDSATGSATGATTGPGAAGGSP